MNKEAFAYQMKQHTKPLSKIQREEILDASMSACDWTVKTIIIMEELAELQKEVSKGWRYNADNELDILEEMADVLMCMEFLKRHYKIDDELLQRAMDVKYRREGERRNVGNKEENV